MDQIRSLHSPHHSSTRSGSASLPIALPRDDLAVLNRYDVPVVCIGRDGRLVRMSEAARTVLGTVDAVADLQLVLLASTAGAGAHDRTYDALVTIAGVVTACSVHEFPTGDIATALVLRPVLARSVGDSALGSLTPRERDVARLIAAGYSARRLAESLGISIHTARRHSERVFQKCAVRSRVALAHLMGAGLPSSI